MTHASFTFHECWWQVVKSLPRKEQYSALEAIIEYGINGTVDKVSPVVDAMLAMAQVQIDMEHRAQDISAKRAMAGAKGGQVSKPSSKTISKSGSKTPSKTVSKSPSKTESKPLQNDTVCLDVCLQPQEIEAVEVVPSPPTPPSINTQDNIININNNIIHHHLSSSALDSRPDGRAVAASKGLDVFGNQSKIDKACMNNCISQAVYNKLAIEILNDWEIADETDWSWRHFNNTLRVKAEMLRRSSRGQPTAEQNRAAREAHAEQVIQGVIQRQNNKRYATDNITTTTQPGDNP